MLQYNKTLRLSVLSLAFILVFNSSKSIAQQSVARQWCEVMLDCIRHDYPRPAVQARTVAHAGWAMYDALSVYDDQSRPYVLGNDLGFFYSEFNGIAIPDNIESAQEKAISFAMYRFLTARFQNSSPPGEWELYMAPLLENTMAGMGYDTSIGSDDYSDGDPAKLGNYIAAQIILLGNLDGTNAQNNFSNQFYNPVNGNIWPALSGNPQCDNPNRWQPVGIDLFYDEFGQPLPTGAPAQTVEWGNAIPFAMTPDDISVRQREGLDWKVYFDPGEPPMLDIESQTGFENPYKWGFIANIILAAKHGNPDAENIDISPMSMGGVQDASNNILDLPIYYELALGGPANSGYGVNPATGLTYEEQSVSLNDFTRTISEYWYNGPNDETPAGHWLRIFNEASDHPLNNRRWQGVSESLSPLEWDVKSYFALGSALYDAAIACWSSKGYYDYISPVSAIRYMCQLGQSSDFQIGNFHPGGMPLIPGLIEIIEPGDPLAIQNPENTGKIKLFTWKGQPNNIETQVGGTGWVVGANWKPYQESDQVSPDYPAYYSEYSALSRAAAEVLQRITGDEYFPGGIGSFLAVEDEFLKVENGPSRDVILQWAKYKDAADQSGLSAVYGGINTPYDDVVGRQIGATTGVRSFALADEMVTIGAPHVMSIEFSDLLISDIDAQHTFEILITYSRAMNTNIAPTITFPLDNPLGTTLIEQDGTWLDEFTYRITYSTNDVNETLSNIRVKVVGGLDLNSIEQIPADSGIFQIDTQNPEVIVNTSSALVNENVTGSGSFNITLHFTEPMNTQVSPLIVFFNGEEQSLELNNEMTYWLDDQNFVVFYNVIDQELNFNEVSVQISNASDNNENEFLTSTQEDLFILDTDNPSATLLNTDLFVSDIDADAGVFTLLFGFSEPMNTSILPQISFGGNDPLLNSMTMNDQLTYWPSETTFAAVYNVVDANEELDGIEVILNGAFDARQNPQQYFSQVDVFGVDTKNPLVAQATINHILITDSEVNGGELIVLCTFDQEMDFNSEVQVSITGPSQIAESLVLNENLSGWSDLLNYEVHYTLLDANVELSGISFSITSAFDIAGNILEQTYNVPDQLSIDTKNPNVISVVVNDNNLTPANEGNEMFNITVVFDQPMNQSIIPQVTFPQEDPNGVLTVNDQMSSWLTPTVYKTVYDVGDITETIVDIDIQCSFGQDLSGNSSVIYDGVDKFSITADVAVSEFSLTELKLYPNPVQCGSDVMIKGEGLERINSIEVYNGVGQKVITSMNNGIKSGNRILTTSSLAPGVYIVQIYLANNSITHKLIISE